MHLSAVGSDCGALLSEDDYEAVLQRSGFSSNNLCDMTSAGGPAPPGDGACGVGQLLFGSPRPAAGDNKCSQGDQLCVASTCDDLLDQNFALALFEGDNTSMLAAAAAAQGIGSPDESPVFEPRGLAASYSSGPVAGQGGFGAQSAGAGPAALAACKLEDLDLRQLETMLEEKKRLLAMDASVLPSSGAFFDCPSLFTKPEARAMPLPFYQPTPRFDPYLPGRDGSELESWTVLDPNDVAAQLCSVPQPSDDSTAMCAAVSLSGSPRLGVTFDNAPTPGVHAAASGLISNASSCALAGCLPSAPIGIDAVHQLGFDAGLYAAYPLGDAASAAFAQSCMTGAGRLGLSPGVALGGEGDSMSNNGSPSKTVGRLSQEERALKLDRYRAKRQARNFNKKIKYVCRKTLADTRPRIRGRFARDDELGATYPCASPVQHVEGTTNLDMQVPATACAGSEDK